MDEQLVYICPKCGFMITKEQLLNVRLDFGCPRCDDMRLIDFDEIDFKDWMKYCSDRSFSNDI